LNTANFPLFFTLKNCDLYVWPGFANRILFSLLQLFQNVSVLETLCFSRKNTLFLRLKQSVSRAKIFWNTFSRGVNAHPNWPEGGREEPKGSSGEEAADDGE